MTRTIDKKVALRWAQKYPFVFFSTSNSIAYPFSGFRNLLAVATRSLQVQPQTDALKQIEKLGKNWRFGALSYDLKNQIEKLNSKNPSLLDMGLGTFFEPEVLIEFNDESAKVLVGDPDWVLREIKQVELQPKGFDCGDIQALTSKQEYEENIRKILTLIEEGEVYELNYCCGFRAKAQVPSPDELFWQLNVQSPMPFACFLKQKSQYLISASPERFVKKSGNVLLSQPIKGTSRRSLDPHQDNFLKDKLLKSPKERAENMMIVDLVRNDLAKISRVGSVEVVEMFGLYTFKEVHQLISTVRSQSDASFGGIMSALFPMGSMTGAPKIRAMQLIDELENFSRGYFSGAAGYITPEGDFDFNVVIRSLMLDTEKSIATFAAGGAITYDSEPESEYCEIETKIKAIVNSLRAPKEFLQ